MQLTDEQVQILDRAQQGWSFVVEAGAGTGKTSTIAQAAEVTPGASGLYLAYNKAIVLDARGSFPDRVSCKTAHGLAFGAIGYLYQQALHSGALQGWQIAKAMAVPRWSHGEYKLSKPTIASMARATVKKWANSADPLIDCHHVPVPGHYTDPETRGSLIATVLPVARQIWQVAQDPEQRMLRFDHDWYLKLFSVMGPGGTVPQLPVSTIFFDECQDADPVIRAIFEGQSNHQRIAVGDSQQAIYAWRGAENAISRFREIGAPMYPLTTSWRFGKTIADEANRWLDLLNGEIRLGGNPGMESQLGPIDPDERYAVLCRTNAGVMEVVVYALEAGRSVAMVGGGKEVRGLAMACEKLHAGREVDHPELIGFGGWSELVAFTEGPDCDNPTLRTLVRLSESYGPDRISAALNACTDEKSAHVVVTTAHKSKGRQWGQVKVSSDFAAPVIRKPGAEKGATKADLRLAYVTVTRARYVLDRSYLRTDETAHA